MPKYLFGQPTDKLVKTNPRLPLKLQRWLARPLPCIASGRMEDFGLPHPNHGFLEAHPTVSSELLLRLGSGDAIAKPNIAELQGDRVRFEDGSVEQVDAIVYATGYKITFPFFDEDFLSAPGQQAAALQADLRAGNRRPRPGRLRADDPDAVPVRRAAEQAGRPVRRRRLRAALRGARWRGRSADDQDKHAATSPTGRGTRCRSTGTLRARHLKQREMPAGRERAPRGDGREARGPRRPARSPPPLPERRDVTFPSQGETLRGLAPGRRGRRLRDEARPSLRRDGARRRRHQRLRAASLRRGVRRRRPRRAPVRLPLLRESTGEPRQLGWPPRHRDDYRAAVEFARGLDGVDPERIVLWGTSWSGGHVVYVAADDPRNRRRDLPDARPRRPPHAAGRSRGTAARRSCCDDRCTGSATWSPRLRGQEPHLIPLAAPPGEIAAMTQRRGAARLRGDRRPDLAQRGHGSRRALRGHETARSPGSATSRCPILIQIAERDSIVPPAAANAAAWQAKGRVRGPRVPLRPLRRLLGEWRERSIADQLHFLRRHLAPAEAAAATGVAAGPAR